MALLTIFTPAYNRAHTIGRTYESLCRQTCKDFEWLVVDDGSTDNTREVIDGFIKQNKIPIRYIYQDNQGMHGAHNTAYENITTELNTCIDSDDWMPDNAVELICDFWKKNGSDEVAGIIGLDQTPEGKIIGTRIPKGLKRTTTTDLYAKGGTGDKKFVYRTDVVRRYPHYPLFEGERYVGLGYLYMLIDQDYEMLTLDEPLVTVDYQLDGSSYNMYNQYWRNPKGFSFLRKTAMIYEKRPKRMAMLNIHYVATSIRSRNWNFLKESPKKVWTFIAIPFGICWYFVIRAKVRKGEKFKLKNK